MNGIKFSFAALAMLLLSACSTNDKTTDTDSADANIMLGNIGLQGEWLLQSYRVDCVSTEFEDSLKYKLNFNEPDNTFSLSTDCNMINGEFGITNDSVRFKNMLVTEMACDDMDVEQSMLRLLNDTTAYALYNDSILTITAQSIGFAKFKRK